MGELWCGKCSCSMAIGAKIDHPVHVMKVARIPKCWPPFKKWRKMSWYNLPVINLNPTSVAFYTIFYLLLCMDEH